MEKDVPSTKEIIRRVQRMLTKVHSEPYVPKIFSLKALTNLIYFLDLSLCLVVYTILVGLTYLYFCYGRMTWRDLCRIRPS
jgi:hypothetical protein